MPGQHKSASLGLRVVATGERPEWPRFVHHRHAGFGRRVAGVVVVVATHQGDAQCGVTRAPLCQRLQHRRRAGAGRMQKIAQAHQVTSAGGGDQRVEPLQVVVRGASRHWLAQRAKARRLAQVQIGDEHGGLGGPPQRRVAQQPQFNACPVHGGVGCAHALSSGGDCAAAWLGSQRCPRRRWRTVRRCRQRPSPAAPTCARCGRPRSRC